MHLLFCIAPLLIPGLVALLMLQRARILDLEAQLDASFADSAARIRALAASATETFRQEVEIADLQQNLVGVSCDMLAAEQDLEHARDLHAALQDRYDGLAHAHQDAETDNGRFENVLRATEIQLAEAKGPLTTVPATTAPGSSKPRAKRSNPRKKAA